MSVLSELREAFRWWMIPLAMFLLLLLFGGLVWLAEPSTLPHEYRVE